MRAPQLVAVTAIAAVVLGLTACGSDKADDVVTMPDVTGKKLDDAYDAIKQAGFDKKDDIKIDGGGMFGVIREGNWTVCRQSPSPGAVVAAAPQLSVERSCDTSSAEPSATPSAPVSTPGPTSDADPYRGPKYEVVTIDEDQGPAKLDHYWIVTKPVSYSTNAYKAQVKLIIEDVARRAGTVDIIVSVVNNREIAEAEAASTYDDFVAEHGEDYAIKVIPREEKAGWIAIYTGGYDSNTNKASQAEDAFEIVWRPADTAEFETWKPRI